MEKDTEKNEKRNNFHLILLNETECFACIIIIKLEHLPFMNQTSITCLLEYGI